MPQDTSFSAHLYKDLTFDSVCDGLRIYYDIYEPSGLSSYPVVIQIAHGMVEHKERYEWVASNLAQKGFVVAINDHRGHGKSIDESHPWGEMQGFKESSPDGFKRAIEDMHQLTEILKSRFKPDKFILLGHSMGSLLSRGYLKLYVNELDALILSGSPAYNPFVGVGKILAQLFKVFKLESKGKNMINALSFGGFNRPFLHNVGEDNIKGGFAWLCRDKAVVEAYKADNACQFVFSLSSFIGLFAGMQWVNDMRDVKAKNLPLLIVSGNRDSCGDFGIGVEKIARQYEKCSLNVNLTLYEGARHEILNEINKTQVLNDIVVFIENVIKTRKGTL